MTLEIACGATRNYVPHLAVMLHSLMARTPRRPLRVWLMSGQPLPSTDLMRLESIVARSGGEWRVLSIDPAAEAAFPRPRHFHPSIWHRLLLPELLPNIGRILYLDADMVIADDLGPLWDTALGPNLFAAVVAPFYPSQPAWPTELGISLDRYVSSGVLLMDLAAMRAENVVARLRAYAIDHPANPCPEQDALNALYGDRCLRLEPRWNAQPIFFDTPPHRLPFPREQVERAVREPAVVHFSGVAKPWHYLSKHPLRGLYFDHLRQTPWPIQPLDGRTLMNRALRLLPTPWIYYAFRGLDAGQSLLRRMRGRARKLLGRGS